MMIAQPSCLLGLDHLSTLSLYHEGTWPQRLMGFKLIVPSRHCKAMPCLRAGPVSAQVKATVQNGNLMHAADMLCSISFDRDDEFFATAGVSRRIKVLPWSPLLCHVVLFGPV